jgi:hypothetical protein
MSPILTGAPERAAVPAELAPAELGVGELPTGVVVGAPVVFVGLDVFDDELHPAVNRTNASAAPHTTRVPRLL